MLHGSIEIRWCEEHNQYVAGENNHCGCEFTEGCWFDNSDDRYPEAGSPCRIVPKMLVDKEEESE